MEFFPQFLGGVELSFIGTFSKEKSPFQSTPVLVFGPTVSYYFPISSLCSAYTGVNFGLIHFSTASGLRLKTLAGVRFNVCQRLQLGLETGFYIDNVVIPIYPYPTGENFSGTALFLGLRFAGEAQ
jgi:hypothetical protein